MLSEWERASVRLGRTKMTICLCLSRTVMIRACPSGIIILIVPLFTFNGSTLEDILQGYPRKKQ